MSTMPVSGKTTLAIYLYGHSGNLLCHCVAHMQGCLDLQLPLYPLSRTAWIWSIDQYSVVYKGLPRLPFVVGVDDALQHVRGVPVSARGECTTNSEE